MNQLPPHQLDALSQIPEHKPVVLFARHSIRELCTNGLASYQLPLTDEGVELAIHWGGQIKRLVTGFYSSPVGRCVDTAIHMSTGLGQAPDISQQSVLVEPGCFVEQINQVGKLFAELGPVAFVSEHLSRPLPGVLSPEQGAMKLLKHFQNTLCEKKGLRIHISHDTILAAFIYCLLGKPALNQDDWPLMMEGVFLWFDRNDQQQEEVHWIWRGKPGKRSLNTLF